MMETDYWQHLGDHLGIEVISPFAFQSDKGPVYFAALLPQFGAPQGMVVDGDWDVLAPHVDTLSNAGYGYSCFDGGRYDETDPPIDMLQDWGWSSTQSKPTWF